jgi:hypothetical protein
MKPFDLEAAKRGEPIVNKEGRKVHFVGTTLNGAVVAEDDRGNFHWHHPNGNVVGYPQNALTLYMAPKKKTVWVNLYESFSGVREGFHYDSELEATLAAGKAARIGGKSYPVEIEE